MARLISDDLDGAQRRSKAALVLVAVASFLLSGCLLRLVYPRLDTIALWQLDRELRLAPEQERWLGALLEERLSWHQREQLPLWRDWLQGVRDDVAARRMSPERHAEHRERLLRLVRESMVGFADVVVKVAASLDDEQVAHFFRRHDEDTEELRAELAEASVEERLEERRQEVLERAEDWLGSLTPAQEDTLAEWSREAIDWKAHAPESRDRWRAALAETLASRNDGAKLRADVERMLRRPESLRSPAYQRALDRYDSHLRALHLSLLGTSTAEQHRYLLDEIDDLLGDLGGLCAAAPGRP